MGRKTALDSCWNSAQTEADKALTRAMAWKREYRAASTNTRQGESSRRSDCMHGEEKRTI